MFISFPLSLVVLVHAGSACADLLHIPLSRRASVTKADLARYKRGFGAGYIEKRAVDGIPLASIVGTFRNDS